MSQQGNDRTKHDENCMAMGMAIGLIMFVPIGIVLSIVTHNAGLLGIGPAVGISLGIAFGEYLKKRGKR
jgi:threonine/homoserine efflux transporter RhtA